MVASIQRLGHLIQPPVFLLYQGSDSMKKLTEKEAYMAMYFFLDKHYSFTKSDDLASLLGSMRILEDGKPADSALWNDWEESMVKAANLVKD